MPRRKTETGVIVVARQPGDHLERTLALIGLPCFVVDLHDGTVQLEALDPWDGKDGADRALAWARHVASAGNPIDVLRVDITGKETISRVVTRHALRPGPVVLDLGEGDGGATSRERIRAAYDSVTDDLSMVEPGDAQRIATGIDPSDSTTALVLTRLPVPDASIAARVTPGSTTVAALDDGWTALVSDHGESGVLMAAVAALIPNRPALQIVRTAINGGPVDVSVTVAAAGESTVFSFGPQPTIVTPADLAPRQAEDLKAGLLPDVDAGLVVTAAHRWGASLDAVHVRALGRRRTEDADEMLGRLVALLDLPRAVLEVVLGHRSPADLPGARSLEYGGMSAGVRDWTKAELGSYYRDEPTASTGRLTAVMYRRPTWLRVVYLVLAVVTGWLTWRWFGWWRGGGSWGWLVGAILMGLFALDMLVDALRPRRRPREQATP